MTAVAQYATMVGFLKGQRLAGVQVQCKLSASYDVIRAEYERLINAVPDEDEEVEKVTVNGEVLPQFSEIKVLEFPSSDTVEIEINGEVREVKVSWDDDTDSGITQKREVAVISKSDVTQKVNVCKVEIFNNDGIYKACPLTKVGGNVEWLYPDHNTVYVRVKGYLNSTTNNWRWIEVARDNQKPDSVVSDSVTVCREVSNSALNITQRYPMAAPFTKVGNKWIFDGDDTGVSWISSVQDCISNDYRIGEMVYLQSEFGQPSVAAFQVTSTYYSKHCLLASIRCEIGNKTWHRGDTTVMPIVQLINCKKAHR
ncbi:hypothetical protein [Nostoc sp.]|uniref:hypothetical protein n=1 Tax=Nostoc sp. TaxID=1180 RepID=UPI002FEE82B8